MVSVHTFFELSRQMMFMRSVSYSNVASWSNRLAPTICSYVPRIPQMHTQYFMMQKKTSWRKTGFVLYRALDPILCLLWSHLLKGLLQAGIYSIWDEALEFGVCSTRLMQGLFGVLAKPTFETKHASTAMMPFLLHTRNTCSQSISLTTMWILL